MRIIIYGSCYGSSKNYAEELSKRTGIAALCYEDIEDINAYDTIIYLGGLYAGGVLGMKKTFQKLEKTDHKNIIIMTVGLADPFDEGNVKNIRRSMQKQLPEDIYHKAQIFHLRGGIEYKKLGLKHKTMMAMLYQKVKNLPEEKKTAEVRAMIDTYNKKVDFIDYSRLDEIVKLI